MFDAGIHTYVRWKVLVSVAWEGGVRGVRAYRPMNLFVVGLVAQCVLVCMCSVFYMVWWCMHVYVMTFLAGPCVLVVSNDMDMLTYSSIRVRCPYLQYTTQDILVFRCTLDRA